MSIFPALQIFCFRPVIFSDFTGFLVCEDCCQGIAKLGKDSGHNGEVFLPAGFCNRARDGGNIGGQFT